MTTPTPMTSPIAGHAPAHHIACQGLAYTDGHSHMRFHCLATPTRTHNGNSEHTSEDTPLTHRLAPKDTPIPVSDFTLTYDPSLLSRPLTTRSGPQVVQRIFYTVNRSWSGRITCEELRRSNFLQVGGASGTSWEGGTCRPLRHVHGS